MIYLEEVRSISHELLPEDSYLNNLGFVSNFKPMKFKKMITFFTGENGTGKSTLLEALALCLKFNPEGGSKNFNFSTRDTHSELADALRIFKSPYHPKDGFFFRAESFYNLATEVEELSTAGLDFLQAYGGKSLHNQSHGESFRSLMLNRFRGNGLYLLDEPEAALSPTAQMSLLCQFKNLEHLNSQMIIATHSPILLAYPDADIFEFNEKGFEQKSYEETNSYIITKAFLNNPKEMLDILFNE